MEKPGGLYAHFRQKSGLYRHLMTVEWSAGIPKQGQHLEVFNQLGHTLWLGAVLSEIQKINSTAVMSASWAGTNCFAGVGDRMVIYVGLYEGGQVWARREDEFFDSVLSDDGVTHVPRFIRQD